MEIVDLGPVTSAGPFVVAYLLTYLVHSTLLIGGTFLACRVLRLSLPLQDVLWKTALVGGVLTAAVQTAGVGSLLGSVVLPEPTATHEVPSTTSRSLGLDADALLPAFEEESARQSSSDSSSRARRRAGNGRADRTREESTTPFFEKLEKSSVLPTSFSSVSDERGPASPGLSAADSRRSPLVPVRSIGRLWPGLVGAFWLAGAALFLLRFRRQRHHLLETLQPRTPIARGRILGLLRRLCREGEVRPRVRLTLSTRLPGPVALQPAEICVPERALSSFDDAQQESMLAHELSHIVRNDPRWLLAARVVEGVFFLQPLNILARKRFQEVSELLCDDWAVARTRHGLPLAKCLAHVAEWMDGAPAPRIVAGMAGHRSQLIQRVQRLLEERSEPVHIKPLRWRIPAVTTLLALMITLAPAVLAGDPPEPAPALVAPAAIVAAPAPLPGNPLPAPLPAPRALRAPALAPALVPSPLALPVLAPLPSPLVVPAPALMPSPLAVPAPVLAPCPAPAVALVDGFPTPGPAVPLPARLAPPGFDGEPPKLGVTLGTMSDVLAAHLDIDPDDVILIDAVSKGSLAEEAGLRRHDILIAINGNPPANVERLREALSGLASGQGFDLGLLRKGERRTVRIGPSGSRRTVPSAEAPRESRSRGANRESRSRSDAGGAGTGSGESRSRGEARESRSRGEAGEASETSVEERLRRLDSERTSRSRGRAAQDAHEAHDHESARDDDHDHQLSHEAEDHERHADHAEAADAARARMHEHLQRMAEQSQRHAESARADAMRALEHAHGQLARNRDRARQDAEAAGAQARGQYEEAHRQLRRMVEQRQKDGQRQKAMAEKELAEAMRNLERSAGQNQQSARRYHDDASKALERAMRQAEQRLTEARKRMEQELRRRQRSGEEIDEDEIEEIEEELEEAAEEIEELMEELADQMEEELEGYAEAVDERAEELAASFEDCAEEIEESLCQDDEDLEDLADEAMDEMEEEIEELEELLEATMEPFEEEIEELVEELLEGNLEEIEELLEEELESLEDEMEEMHELFEDDGCGAPSPERLSEIERELGPRLQDLDRRMAERMRRIEQELRERLQSVDQGVIEMSHRMGDETAVLRHEVESRIHGSVEPRLADLAAHLGHAAPSGERLAALHQRLAPAMNDLQALQSELASRMEELQRALQSELEPRLMQIEAALKERLRTEESSRERSEKKSDKRRKKTDGSVQFF